MMEDIDTSYANTINPLFFNMRTWHLPSLPHIYSAVFTYLRHVCKEKICRNPFFRQVDDRNNGTFNWDEHFKSEE